jgi:quercetin dioxygenase-like cupin family protein
MRLPGFFVAAALAWCAALPALADDQSSQAYQNLLTPILKGGVDVLGTPLAYPDGPAMVTSAIVTIPPGGTTGWHHHEVPLFAYILEGELTVEYRGRGSRTYRAGEGVLEAVNLPHNGTNTGSVPVKLLAVYMGGGTAANTLADPLP